MKKILVTGHLGFIGSHLMKKIDAIGLDIKEGNDILTCDLPDADTVIHLAAQPGVMASIEDPVKTVENNITGTVRLLKRYKNSKFIFASTGGAIQKEIISPYGLSKFCAEEFVKLMHDDYVILRFSNVYGAGSRSVVDKFLKEDITIYGDGTQMRTFVYIDDLVEGVVNSLDWAKGSYHFGTDQDYSIIELAEAMKKPIKFSAAREGELIYSKVENTTPNWQATIDVSQYIRSGGSLK